MRLTPDRGGIATRLIPARANVIKSICSTATPFAHINVVTLSQSSFAYRHRIRGQKIKIGLYLAAFIFAGPQKHRDVSLLLGFFFITKETLMRLIFPIRQTCFVFNKTPVRLDFLRLSFYALCAMHKKKGREV